MTDTIEMRTDDALEICKFLSENPNEKDFKRFTLPQRQFSRLLCTGLEKIINKTEELNETEKFVLDTYKNLIKSTLYKKLIG